MCGIAGVFNVQNQSPVDPAALAAMGEQLNHRGPDARGQFSDGPIGLVHRRLSILDLSERGTQPLRSADGRFVIVYNGEVYNYVELRRELEARGDHFRTDTDTEVVLALYARLGVEALSRLNGMFALAIWDSRERSLFLARDRLGIKPLYYAETPDGIAFASEAKALVAAGVPADVDLEAIRLYMGFGYVPGSRSAFRRIRKLLPGWWMRIDARGLESRCYWDISYEPQHWRSAAATAGELRALLLDAVRIHLRSDVPVGVFLSGGLDSSAVVALLSESGVAGINTFSVAYRHGSTFDETRFARLVADRYGTSHHVLYVDPVEFRDFVPRYVWHMDEPVTEAAGLSLYFIARRLRQHVTVALSGEGADELFGGYQIYRYMSWLERYRRLPARLRSGVLEPFLLRCGALDPRVRKYVQLARRPLHERYLGVSLPDDEPPDLLAPAFEQATSGIPHPLAECYARAAARGYDLLATLQYADLKSWLVDDLLIKADKMTMASSVELRVPFLDHRVVELAATIPSSMKIRRGVVKWILKRAFEGRLPRPVLARRKLGFPTPIAAMLRRELSGFVRETLLSARAVGRGYFERPAIERLIAEHQNGARDHHRLLWKLIVLEHWHREFPDRAASSRAPDGVPAAAAASA